MAEPSRQEVAYKEFLTTFFKLIDRARDIPDKEVIKTEMHEIFGYPVIEKNMMQAFSNFMWSMDETIERKVYDELESLIDMIPAWADPNDVNTLAIQANLTQIIAVGGTKSTDIEEDEIDKLTEGETFDDSRPAGL